ncbi:MAG: DNA polymerase III subunit gamma/tau [Firmicutes bacterium]|nr:DNA polymerase III subunit gamma/tau [Bacillota bacterium]
MAHQASYRVYRPRAFNEVQGQTVTVNTLREAVRQGRLTHAYLFAGPRGTGKTSVARILAKAVNCESLREDGNPCLQCESCRSVESGQHLDVIEIDAASNRGIDEIRDLKERITHQPAQGRYKVYIIDEVHMLTQDAFNALLKTLEEPPPHVLFVLATTEAHKLPITVLSRCQRYEFKRLTVSEIAERLRYVAEQEHVPYEDEALEILAEASDGALRDALSLFDQAVAVEGRLTAKGASRMSGMLDQRQMEALVAALRGPIDQVVETLAQIRQDGADDKLILRDLARQLRDLLLYRVGGAEFFPAYRRDSLSRMSAALPAALEPLWWINAADRLAEAESRLRGGFPSQLAVELAVLKLQQEIRAAGADRDSPAAESRSSPQAVSPPSENAPESSSDPYPAVLEVIKRERPITYGLFEWARGIWREAEGLLIEFDSPVHFAILQEPRHREVLDRAVKAVLGPQGRYQVRLKDEGSPPQPDPAPTSLAEEVRAWFGDEVLLKGFEEDQAK